MSSPCLCTALCKGKYSGDDTGEGQTVIRFPPTHPVTVAGAGWGSEHKGAARRDRTASTFTPRNIFKNVVRDNPRRLAYKSFCSFLCSFCI